MVKKLKITIRDAIGVWILMASMWFMGFLAGRASKENEIIVKEDKIMGI